MEEQIPQEPIISPDQTTITTNVQKLKSSGWKIGLVFFIIIIFSIAGYSIYQNLQQSPIISYEECLIAKGSLIQETYPQVCITKDGLRFTQEVPPITPPLTKAEECYEQVTNVECPLGTVCMANPASSFCECMGGSIEIRESEEGQYGVCLIDETEYEEWEYFRMMNPQENRGSRDNTPDHTI